MAIQTIEFNAVSFHYPDQNQTLFEQLNLTFGPGWTACIGSNGSGKSTVLKLSCGELQPDSGTILRPESCIYIPQRTDTMPPGYEDFAYCYDSVACKLHGILSLDRDIPFRWNSLSHGERKRAQIGWALFQESSVLAVDEPTNHLDEMAMALIETALAEFKGIGILVSHDRNFSDQLCTKTLVVHAPHFLILGCPPSVAIQQVRQMRDQNLNEYQVGNRNQTHLTRELQVRSKKASVQDRLRSKRHLDAKDHDSKAKIDAARVSGRDGKAGRLAHQLERRASRSSSDLSNTFGALVRSNLLDLSSSVSGITLSGSPLPSTFILQHDGCSLPLGPLRHLRVPSLAIGSKDKIGIRGPNGTGKTTLVNYLLSLLDSSRIKTMILPQELDIEETTKLYAKMLSFDEGKKGRVISTMVRLGSDPSLILATALPSPGEARKLLLAIALEEEMNLLVLDEPTNHLDLPARLALEQALGSFQGAILCVSHDRVFLDGLCPIQWVIEGKAAEGESQLRVV